MNNAKIMHVINHNICRINSGVDEKTAEQLRKINLVLYSLADYHLYNNELDQMLDRILADDIWYFFEL